MPANPDELLTVRDVAAILKCARSTVYLHVLHEVPVVMRGRLVRVRRGDLDAWLAAHTVPPRAEAARRVTAAEAFAMVLGPRKRKRRGEAQPAAVRLTQPRTRPADALREAQLPLAQVASPGPAAGPQGFSVEVVPGARS